MIGSPVVDVHAHVSETKALASWSTQGYEIWEYGKHQSVRFGSFEGDLQDLEAAMDRDGIDHAVVVNCFTVDEWRNRALSGPRAPTRFDDVDGSLAEELFAFNRWLIGSLAARPSITPFVAMDPWVAPLAAMEVHLEEMQAMGAGGVKIHPVEQRFAPPDPRSVRLLRRCAELRLPVISHSGPARDPTVSTDPSSFAPVLDALPDLRLVVAHLGGAAWKQAAPLAAAFPAVAFDCSEIVAWLGAPNAPDPVELVALIHEIGVDRVMFGSDFPWYDPGPAADIVRELPGLSEAERDAILGENAVRLLGLSV